MKRLRHVSRLVRPSRSWPWCNGGATGWRLRYCRRYWWQRVMASVAAWLVWRTFTSSGAGRQRSHLIGDPRRTLGEPVVDAASAVVVVSGEPADERPSALPCEFGQRGDELVGDPATAKFGIDEEIVEETDGAAVSGRGMARK